MKKLLNLLCLFAVLASSCSREELLIDEAATSLNDIIFTAGFEQETRTYIQDGTFLRWNEGDQISIFVANTLNRQYKFDGETGDNGGTFSVVDAPFGTGNDLACHYAVYPYAAGVKITEKGVVTTALPAEQSYAENSFGLGANTMVAVTKDTDDTFLKFKNVCGYLMLQLYGENVTVKSITLTGNNDEKLAGKATVTPLYGQEPTIAMSDDATTSITLNCGDGVKLGAAAETATAFWIVVPPTTFDEGFEITVTDVDGGTFTKSTSKEVAIERNVIKPMAAFEVEIEEIIPNNEIWYTATAKVEPNASANFGATIVSNEWDSNTGKGVIKFDAPVTSIGYRAFNFCTSLTSVTIPDSVTEIGDDAFGNCSSLTSITIPDSVTAIGDGAFGNCSSLTSITIGDSVTSIGEYAFHYCTSLTSITIPDSVTSIEQDAFKNCTSLTSVTIGNGVTTIEYFAFYNCRNLTSITIPDNVTSIGDAAFGCCRSLTEFKGKFASNDGRCLIVDGVLNSYAPAGLSKYTIPNSVTSIGEAAFSGCSSLTSVTIGNNVTSIGEDAFYGCSSLTSVTIPDSVTTIEFGAFMGCSNLTSVTIPDSVTSIEVKAFHACGSLADVYCKPTTPPTSDYGYMFDFNVSGRKIYVPMESVGAYKSAKYWSDYASDIIAYDFEKGEVVEVIPNNEIWYTSSDGKIVTPYDTDVFGAAIIGNEYKDGKGIITFNGDVTSIGERAFYYCSSLTSITIPDSVTEIGDYAFRECRSLTSITIPDNVTSIGNYAFTGCSSLTSITIPDGVTEIAYYAFYKCSSLTSITIPDSVTSIGNYAFYGCSSLTSITIPDSVTSIEGYAFCECASLTSVTIGNGVTEIGGSAFEKCSSLTSVNIPDSVTSIGVRAFRNCTSLTSVTIPNSVTEIGEGAFRECRSLTSVTIGNGVTEIGGWAFSVCERLTSITIPNSVTSIGERAFSYCSSLTSITIPDSVTEIGDYAFRECSSLTSITIPDSVTEIGEDAFSECSSLTSVYCKPTTPPTGGYHMFSVNASGLQIFVPAVSVDAYKSAEYWSDYAFAIEGYDF